MFLLISNKVAFWQNRSLVDNCCICEANCSVEISVSSVFGPFLAHKTSLILLFFFSLLKELLISFESVQLVE